MLHGAAASKQGYVKGRWDRLEFFIAFATEDKSFQLIPRDRGQARLQNPRARVVETSLNFLKAV
jgi:hypothetical protein